MDKLRDLPQADTEATKRHYDSFISDLYDEGRMSLYQMLSDTPDEDKNRKNRIKNEIKILLQQMCDDYHKNTRYFLVDWLANSSWRRPCVRKDTKSDYYIPVGGKKHYFNDLAPEDLELTDEEESDVKQKNPKLKAKQDDKEKDPKEDIHNLYKDYIDVLTDIACFHEGKQVESRIKNILKTAFQSRKSIYVLLRTEAIDLAHALRMSFPEASRFLFKNVQEDGEWDFKKSDDQIHRYVFLHDLGLEKVEELQQWYAENCKRNEGTLLNSTRDNKGNITFGLTENDSEIMEMTEEAFKDYLSRNAKYFGSYSRTAIGLIRNLVRYYLNYSNGELFVDAGFYEKKEKKISECSDEDKEFNFDKWIRTFCLDGNGNVKDYEQEILEKIKKKHPDNNSQLVEREYQEYWEDQFKKMLRAFIEGSSISKDKPYQYLRSFSFDKEHVHLQFPMERYLEILQGKTAVKKQDLLFFLFICCNLSWGEYDEEQSYMASRFNGFTELADLFLDVGFLPPLYLPAAFEETLLRSILDAGDGSPLTVYETYGEVYSSREKPDSQSGR